MSVVIEKPQISIAPELLKELQSKVYTQGQVVLHFLFISRNLGDKIRIWPTTYLYDKGSSHRSEMVHFENITLYPQWQLCNSRNYFTLIFSGLPKSCKTFDFIEHCTEEFGAFQVLDIKRNEQDVYYISMLG